MSAGDNVRSFDAAVPQPARDRFAIDLWCHACRQRKRALLDRPPTEADETLSCPTCMSEFVERLDEPPRQRHAAAGPTQPRRNTHIRFMRRLPPGVVPGVSVKTGVEPGFRGEERCRGAGGQTLFADKEESTMSRVESSRVE